MHNESFAINSVYNIWSYSEKLDGTNYTIKGHSRASERSSFFIPELNILLDAGLPTNFSPNLILVTHCHSDHCCSLPMVIVNIDSSVINSKIVVPKKQEQMFNKSLDADYNLYMESYSYKPKYNLIGIEPNKEFEHNKLLIKTYKSDHSVNCLSYGIIEVRKKLKEEYKGLNGKELVALKKEGVVIDEKKYEKMFVYVGDTTIKILKNYPELFEYKTIIIECTYLFEEDEMHLENKKHIHWKLLKPYIQANPGTYFLLIHFSLRYKNREIKEFLEKEKMEMGIDNFRPWLN